MFVLSKQDLWDALQEYPEAKKMLIEKGRQFLRKDNLLDEELAKRQDMEQVSVEQKVEVLETTFDNVDARMTRLLTDFEAMQQEMKTRLTNVETRLRRRRRTVASCETPAGERRPSEEVTSKSDVNSNQTNQ